MKKRKIIFTLSVLFILFLILLVIKEINNYIKNNEKEQIVLITISNKLNVNADWKEVRYEIYCNRIPLGITLEEIQVEINNITPIEIVRDHEVYQYYSLYFLDSNLKIRDMSLSFNIEGKLTEKLIYAGFGETMPVECK